jgi:UDP-glucose 4-epimerase
MKVLITGGAGCVGTALVEKLSFLPEVKSIIVYDNLSNTTTDFFFHSKLDKTKVTFVEGDILETRNIQKWVKQSDIVVHLASLDTEAGDNLSAHHMEQVNHWGTAELTYAIENASVKKLIYLSSAMVYGHDGELKNENSEPLPVDAFSSSKLRGEGHVMRLEGKLNTIVFRPGVMVGFGPVKKIKGVANQFLFDMITKKRLSIHGNGKQLRPFVSFEHVVESIFSAIVKEMPSGIYNLVETNLQVLDVLEEVKKIQPDVEFVFSNHHLQLPSLSVTTEHADKLPKSHFDLGQLYVSALKNIVI